MRGRPRRTLHAKPGPASARANGRLEPSSGAAGESAAPRRKCVLVVEDNATVGGLLVALLREEGYRSLRAWDLREAVKMARDRRPDLLVLDLSLPYPDGLPMLDELRACEDTKHAPIVLVSGSALQLTPEQREILSETVTKPFDIDAILNVFRRALGDPEQLIAERAYTNHDTDLNGW